MNVVFLCTGNRFRSPLAAAVFRATAGTAAVHVESFGTLELGRLPALPEAVAAARAAGLDLGAHRARAITPGALADADLVLGFERDHVVSAVIDGRAGRESAFTLPELAELLGQLEPTGEATSPEVLVARAHALRHESSHDWRPPEIPDPLGLDPDAQRAIAARVEEIAATVARALFARS
jgi:protein-tyrosine phosphatase